MGLGGLFVAIKLGEYAEEIGRGIGLETSPFFTLYFLLDRLPSSARLPRHHHPRVGLPPRAEAFGVETGTAFWHMVDLVWIVMFPILYLVR